MDILSNFNIMPIVVDKIHRRDFSDSAAVIYISTCAIYKSQCPNDARNNLSKIRAGRHSAPAMANLVKESQRIKDKKTQTPAYGEHRLNRRTIKNAGGPSRLLQSLSKFDYCRPRYLHFHLRNNTGQGCPIASRTRACTYSNDT